MTIRHNRIRPASWLKAAALLLLVSAPALAAVAQAYKFSGTPPVGALVAVDPNHSGAVVLATTQNIDGLSGVIITSTGSGLTVGKGETLVSSSGVVNVLVSDVDGPIKRGDYITVSSVAGVASKAGQTETMLGVAQAEFNGHESGDVDRTIGSGSTVRTIHVGQLPVQLGIGVYTPGSNGTASSFVPGAVQRLADTLAGRPVSTIRIILAGLLLVFGLFGAIIITYASVRSSILSIGRNPLSSRSVYRSLLQVGLIILVILTVSFSAVYAVIRL